MLFILKDISLVRKKIHKAILQNLKDGIFKFLYFYKISLSTTFFIFIKKLTYRKKTVYYIQRVSNSLSKINTRDWVHDCGTKTVENDFLYFWCFSTLTNRRKIDYSIMTRQYLIRTTVSDRKHSKIWPRVNNEMKS